MNAPLEKMWEGEVFRPWDDVTERHLRSRILKCQRVATQRIKTTSSDHARTVYWVALDMASHSAFAQAKLAHLKDVIHGLTRLFLVAAQIERWEGSDGI